MSIRSLLIATLAVATLVGCSKKTGEKDTDTVTEDQAQDLAADDTQDALDAAAEDADNAPDAEMASAALQRFGTSIFQELSRDQEDENLAISPWSIESALVMTAAGAKGDTLAQMLYALGFVHLADNPDGMQQSFAELSEQLLERATKASPDADEDSTEEDAENADDSEESAEDDAAEEDVDVASILHAANAIWVDHNLRDELQKDFQTTLEKHHKAEVHDATFQEDAEAARTTINDWIAKNTRQKIEELLPSGSVDDATRIVLTNAIAFDADWTDAFDKDLTETKPFHTLDGETVDVDLMHRKFNKAAYWEGDNFHAVELPYEDGNFAMSIVVPTEGKWSDVRNQLIEEGFEDVFSTDRAQEKVDVYLPRFQFRWNRSLSDALQALGMENAFDGRADFSALFSEGSHAITEVIHEVYIDVDEEGTEAAAATGAVVGVTSAPMDPPKVYEVRADRPFLFAIHDTESNTPIFLGQVTDPTQD